MSLTPLFFKHSPLRNIRCSLLPFRPFSSGGTPISFTLSFEPELEPEPETPSPYPNPNDDLRSRIFRLRFSKRSATAALDKWVGEGKEVTQAELRQIAKDLKRSQRYKHALEISEWMKSHQEFELSDSDYAMRIELITKVFGVNAAEEFFEGLPSAAKTCEVYTALLHAYAKAKLTEKAENLFERIKESNFSPSALTYNEMMTLYMSVGQLEKVPEVVEELKKMKVSPDLFTYNLWISASAATLDVKGVREILDEMAHDSNSDEGWKTYMKLADIYVTAGHLVNSDNSLVETEKKISQREWITYDFLIILYSGLGNTEGISEIWKSLKMTSQKMTSRNYACVLSSYLVLGHLKEAGEVIDDWMQSKVLDFDVSACNRLLDAFVKAGLIEAAEAFQGLMLQRSCELSSSLDNQ
nr:pentatricopeptide repeat protein AaPPR444 [Agave angustifolia]